VVAASLLAALLAVFLAQVLLALLRPGPYWRAHPEWISAAVAVAAVAAAAAVLLWLRPTGRGALRIAFWLVFLLLGGLIALVAPGATIFFLAPPAVALAGIALARFAPGRMAQAEPVAFLLAWVVSHLRRPGVKGQGAPGILATLSLWASYVPVALTCVAALGAFVPTLAPFILKAFALAVLVAAFVWCFAVVAIIVGGTRQSLSRARRALLLAGTPWYCLAVYLSTWL
jgi:hypothetical protein